MACLDPAVYPSITIGTLTFTPQPSDVNSDFISLAPVSVKRENLIQRIEVGQRQFTLTIYGLSQSELDDLVAIGENHNSSTLLNTAPTNTVNFTYNGKTCTNGLITSITPSTNYYYNSVLYYDTVAVVILSQAVEYR